MHHIRRIDPARLARTFLRLTATTKVHVSGELVPFEVVTRSPVNRTYWQGQPTRWPQRHLYGGLFAVQLPQAPPAMTPVFILSEVAW